eukprot:TRINITY_DN2006_c0_g2_i2.p1 TRINITY_DN2006_c0_g2~~TRINITY_DN2006_c0_g2_i2.p1  ORF type:complete len:161 (+),score=28.37 TRINITY_DN2006_c0_g2_i2:162-644(+)
MHKRPPIHSMYRIVKTQSSNPIKMSTTSTWSRIATPIVIGSAILYGVHKAGLLPFNKPPTTTQITPTTPTTPSPCSQSSSTSSPSSYIGQSSHWTNLCQNLDTIKQVPIQDLIVDIHSISQSLSAKHKQGNHNVINQSITLSPEPQNQSSFSPFSLFPSP